MRVRLIALAGAVALALTGVVQQAAEAAPEQAAATCGLPFGSVTSGGDYREGAVFATRPPSVTDAAVIARDVFADGLVRLSTATWGIPETPSVYYRSYVVLGATMYDSLFGVPYRSDEVVYRELTRIGGGWDKFVAVEESEYWGPNLTPPHRKNVYGLRNDGVLFRWTVSNQGLWSGKTSYPGFAAVKSMALISKTATYDTFLANTRGGALYTIHIPTSSPMKPVVKLVRRTTWQGFEAMLATKCGTYGTLLVGIDKDTHAGYLYAVGHANGLSTVIEGRGKIPATFADSVNFRYRNEIDPMFGE